MKGVTLIPGTIVVLSLDGSLVYVEAVEQTHAAVVALPEQPAAQSEYGQRVFTAGRVGAKKISPFSVADKEVPVADLTERNKIFLGGYEKLRETHGPNYVDRTPEEQKAHDAAMAGPVAKSKKQRATPEEKQAARDAKKAAKKGGPKYLQRCAKCNEQPGHPNHPADHVFEAPPAPVVAPEACAACGNPETDAVHADGGSHKFIGASSIKGTRKTKPAKEPKEPKAAKPGRPSKPGGVAPNVKHRWVGSDTTYDLLVAVNPKFSAKNSGGSIVDAVKGAGATGISIEEVMQTMATHPRWCSIPVDRYQLAFGQMLAAKLIEAC